MKLHKLSLEEQNNMTRDMKLYGHFDRDEIDAFIEDEYLTKDHIKNIGNCLIEIKKKYNIMSKKSSLNQIVYDYIMNVGDIQTLVRYEMNRLIILNKKKYVKFFLNDNFDVNGFETTPDKILRGVLMWYKYLYDKAGILEFECLNILLNLEPGIFDHRESMYNILCALNKE